MIFESAYKEKKQEKQDAVLQPIEEKAITLLGTPTKTKRDVLETAEIRRDMIAGLFDNITNKQTAKGPAGASQRANISRKNVVPPEILMAEIAVRFSAMLPTKKIANQ